MKRLPGTIHPTASRPAPPTSIARKLAILVTIAVVIASVALSGVSLWQELSRYAETKAKMLVGAAHIFASASAPAVAARDAGSAYQAMKAIARMPDFRYARIDTSPGHTLAVLGGATQLDDDLRIQADGDERIPPLSLLSSSSIEVDAPIVSGGVNVGRFILVADTSDLADQLWSSLRGALLGGLFALILGLFVAARLQRGLTRPLRELSDTIWRIRSAHDYDARVEAKSNDEVGVLIDSFNTMLEEIQTRDQRLEAHRRNLEKEVTDRTQDYRAAKEAAEAANAAKSDFLATMSHEIRTPMNGVMAMAELLAAADIPQRQRRYAEVISKSGQSLLAIINDILDFSKIESGKLELERIALDPEELASDVTSLFAGRASEKGLDLAGFISPATPSRIAGDPVRINQVVGNLVNNALKFSDRGSVSLEVGPDPKDPSRIVFAVSDTGIGIPKDKLGEIFGAFAQADQSTTRRFGGTGLGLAISRRLIKAMGGELTVESELGKGSKFAFSISAEDRGPPPPWPGAAGGRKDEPLAFLDVRGEATLKALQRYLRAAGYRVLSARDGAPPPEAALMIVDPDRVPMTRRDGGARIICMAALGDPSSHRRVKEGRADAVLSRPLERSEIFDVLLAIEKGAPLAGPAAPESAPRGRFAVFPNLRALVADDGAVNREVAIEALTRLEAVPTTVENGLEAVEAALGREFDIVLMDVSMPELDGFEAARRIRAAEAEQGRRRTPIVAVTAHVIGGAADAWRDAGMDAVLHKPFTVSSLAACLGRFFTPNENIIEAKATTPEATQATPRPSAPPLLDETVLQDLASTGPRGSTAFMEKVFGIFIEQAPKSAAKIEAAFGIGNIAEIGRVAHAIKSMSFNIGAAAAAAMAAELERRANLEPDGVGPDVIAQMTGVLAETCVALDKKKAALSLSRQKAST
jgi:signal transduction histidine kinase/CheY-like chemotaxis protein